MASLGCGKDTAESAGADGATSTSGASGGSESATSTSGPSGTESASSTSAGSSAGGDVDDLCQTYAALSVECYPELSYEGMLAYCIALIEGTAWGYGDDCASLYLEGLVCDMSSCGGISDECEAIFDQLGGVCMIEVGPVCAAYGEAASVCRGGSPEVYAYDCQRYASGSALSGVPCGLATEDYFACLTATECAAWNGACTEEVEARNVACGQFPGRVLTRG